MRYVESAVTLAFIAKRCNGCGLCTKVCLHMVLRTEDGRAVAGCVTAVLSGLAAGTGPACGCSGKSSHCC